MWTNKLRWICEKCSDSVLHDFDLVIDSTNTLLVLRSRCPVCKEPFAFALEGKVIKD